MFAITGDIITDIVRNRNNVDIVFNLVTTLLTTAGGSSGRWWRWQLRV